MPPSRECPHCQAPVSAGKPHCWNCNRPLVPIVPRAGSGSAGAAVATAHGRSSVKVPQAAAGAECWSCEAPLRAEDASCWSCGEPRTRPKKPTPASAPVPVSAAVPASAAGVGRAAVSPAYATGQTATGTGGVTLGGLLPPPFPGESTLIQGAAVGTATASAAGAATVADATVMTPGAYIPVGGSAPMAAGAPHVAGGTQAPAAAQAMAGTAPTVPLPASSFRICGRCKRIEPLYHNRCSVCGMDFGPIQGPAGVKQVPGMLPQGWTEHDLGNGYVKLRPSTWTRLVRNGGWAALPVLGGLVELTDVIRFGHLWWVPHLILVPLTVLALWLGSRYQEEWTVGPDFLEVRTEFLGKKWVQTFRSAWLRVEREHWSGWTRWHFHRGVPISLVVEGSGKRRELADEPWWFRNRLHHLARYVAEITGWTLQEEETFGWPYNNRDWF